MASATHSLEMALGEPRDIGYAVSGQPSCLQQSHQPRCAPPMALNQRKLTRIGRAASAKLFTSARAAVISVSQGMKSFDFDA